MKFLSLIAIFLASTTVWNVQALAEQGTTPPTPALNPNLAVCFGCHGADGKAINPEWPNLACQNEDYMNNQIKAFRENLRPGPNMAPILAIIKDEDFKAATKYYANLEHCKK